ncbi:hypothetical protein WA026_022186 [Henosepilachna vigintioctopunctata]|uniref:Peptidase M14 domain-containing protein n=1 Tax=Henosepilachna vigintioctopunctata TaxID=420089 RepID=A0AAW1TYU1_9CUCU
MNAFNLLSVLLFFFVIWLYFAPSDALNFDYHNEAELEVVLRNFTQTTKNINTKLYSIGKSTFRRTPLWVMQLSSVDKSRKMVPNIKFVANIHGNEAVGREMLLHFMEYLRDNYEKDNLVKCLLDNSNIHLLPCMNPDGFNVSIMGQCAGDHGRKNGENGETEDLNRNFPDKYHENRNPRQQETNALMKWMNDIPFILSAGLHGGAMVANYPYDTREIEISDDSKKKQPSETPDGDVFIHLSSVYASNHPQMKKIQCTTLNGNAPKFENGITNGAAWYSFQGGMQDYNYYKHGCMEVTLEISCCKYPMPKELPDLWEQNKKALLMYSLEALKGVSGQILDDVSKKPIGNAI